MRGKSRGGAVAAAVSKVLEAVRDALVPGPAPVLRPIPVRRPAAPRRRD